MRKLILLFFFVQIVISASLLFFVTPSLAANCDCYYTEKGPHSCFDDDEAACKKRAIPILRTCNFNATQPFFSDTCGAELLVPITKSCTQASECQNIPPCQIGQGKCENGSCLVDPNLKKCWDSASSYFGQTIEFKPPNLEIRIPGVDFSKKPLTVDPEGFLTVSYLVDYIKAIYKFLAVAASIVAAIVIILSGFRISMSAGGEEKGEGIKRVGQAVIGLFIMWSSYAILYTINPNLTQLKPIRVKYIIPEPLFTSEDEDPLAGNTTEIKITSSTEKSDALKTEPKITIAQGVVVTDDLAVAISAAAKSITDPAISFKITSGYRSVEKQIAAIKENCNNPVGSATCNPKKGVTACMLTKGPASCPHTTGRAVDVWGSKNDGASQCLSRDICVSNLDACRKNPCQAAVIAAMKSAGFCNLQSEPWHFENPPMSSTCTK
jgi:D-alanyl-D-alanine dipeptidase